MAVKGGVDLTSQQRQVILSLLNTYLPGIEVWVYGSRIKGTTRLSSDLDMVVFSLPDQSADLFQLREAFDESDLPFRVDLFVWDEVPEQFRKI